jgi:hypothetical protein
VANRHTRKTRPDVVEKILEIQTEHYIEALLIMYYLDRHHGIKNSESTVIRVLKAHGLSRIPKTAAKRALHTKRCGVTSSHVVASRSMMMAMAILHLQQLFWPTCVFTNPQISNSTLDISITDRHDSRYR